MKELIQSSLETDSSTSKSSPLEKVEQEGSPLHGLTFNELKGLFRTHGLCEHQARLTFQNIHRSGKLYFSEMAGMSSACRRVLESFSQLPRLAVEAVHRAEDTTTKLRLKTPGGDAVETVIIPSGRRVTLCISSQVGCAAACSFCHTGTMGLRRNLEAWEIVEQYRVARQYWTEWVGQTFLSAGTGKNADATSPITNIVFMGMGEPLHNEANVTQACRILNDDIGAGFPRRRLVMSTAGVGNRIRPFWEEGVASLSVSLHATTDELRDRLVPMNRQWNLSALRKILLDIPWRKSDTLMLAYLLMDGVNDSNDDALRLAQWVKGLPAKINLLEFNPFPGTEFRRTPPHRRQAFRKCLFDAGAFTTCRVSRGEDVMAACGQLAVD